jgi:hypothetical protein
MRTVCYGAAALALLCAPALAQQNAQDRKPAAQNGKTLDPVDLSVNASKRALKLDDRMRAQIVNGLVAAHTQQKTPRGFAPQVGQPLTMHMKVDVFPPALVQREPTLKQYGYAKTAKNILVLDPMNRKIIAVLPRQYPATGKAPTPAEWAGTRGRELTGQAPAASNSIDEVPQPAGDAGDVKNGNAQNAEDK